ncbi:MAG: UPF0175 family protein [Aequorivita sp.]
MRNLKLNLPETINLDDFEISMIIASKLYEQGKLSLGEAAIMVNISKEKFMELLSEYGVSVFSTSIADLHQDIDNA